MLSKKFIRITLALSFALASLTLNLTCSNLVAPEDIQPGRRDYVWTVDTLRIPYTNLHRIWGSSPNDVWAIGPGGDLDKTIFHFDGVRWSNDGISRPISPRSIWGFGEKDVWICGQNGRIWHYDGYIWEENYKYNIPDVKDIIFQGIWGNRADHLFVVGLVAYEGERRNGVILKYDGNNWILKKNWNVGINSQFYFATGISYDNNLYALGIIEPENKNDTIKLFKLDNSNLIEIHSEAFLSTDNIIDVINIGDRLFYLFGRNVYKKDNGNNKFILSINESQFNNGLSGRNEKDLFINMRDGIMHYDGNDLKYVFHYPGIHLFRGLIFEKDVFFLAWDLAKGFNLIIRGKLN